MNDLTETEIDTLLFYGNHIFDKEKRSIHIEWIIMHPKITNAINKTLIPLIEKGFIDRKNSTNKYIILTEKGYSVAVVLAEAEKL